MRVSYGGGPGGGMESLMRSMRRGQSVENRKIGKATARRILGFARPYRTEIAVFLLTVVLAAVIGVATPLLAGRVVNTIVPEDGRPLAPDAGRTVIVIALVIGALAVLSALLSLAERFYSSRIGEGLIYDLRTRVYDHVQRMPVQFFTR
ncbi:ABC transporter transmembrane domain-containing protein, partial [Catellatospora sp. NPDC049609]|uniref:ABC transporter transmembrane domain-containing protein n=1 Tax=Catellatospora sp. NPDC049609 TaxID=3155505 RepID=UPI0034330CF5